VYRGNYTKYVDLRAERLARRMTQWKEQQEQIAKTQAFVRRYKAGQRTKEAQGREKRLERLERLDRPRQAQTIKLRLDSDLRSGELVLRTYDLVVGYDQPLLAIPNLELHRLHRAALIGPNGSGKTTFLKTVLGEMPPLLGRVRLGASLQIGYWAQSREDLNPANRVVDEIMQVGDMLIADVRDFLARFLFTGDDVFKRVGDLSGGEQCRVALAKLTLAKPNFLVLDEPTNQLDIPSQEIVEYVLREFIGTVLFVSHDRYLIDALATQVWALEDGQLRVYEGNYQEYLVRRQAEAAVLRERLEREREAERLRRHEARSRQSQLPDHEQMLCQVETEIADVEQTLRDLEHAMAQASAEQDLDRLRAFDVEYKRLQVDLDRLIGEWSALGEAIG
jgi:ATP-binding cassette subfamily F protein 3